VAAFQELERAFVEFAKGGVTRVVVFVDDLDRCLPVHALEVLESMKLFFDLPGFIFVVGLDEDVIERAIRVKFAESDEANVHSRSPQASLGREYVKKIFQVPYSLPPMIPQQLEELLESMYEGAYLGSDQLEDLRNRVGRYLQYVVIERRVNPREVKRFINAYTLQMLIRPDLDPDTVLALQVLAFRYEWVSLYKRIFLNSEAFVLALRAYRDDLAAGGLLSQFLIDQEDVPESIRVFFLSAEAEPLVSHRSLDVYLSSLTSTQAPSLEGETIDEFLGYLGATFDVSIHGGLTVEPEFYSRMLREMIFRIMVLRHNASMMDGAYLTRISTYLLEAQESMMAGDDDHFRHTADVVRNLALEFRRARS
jgi:hypothetical protein